MGARPSPFQLESNFEYEGPATVRTARQIFASQPKVRPAVDANFSSIFRDRNKVVVLGRFVQVLCGGSDSYDGSG